MQASQLSTQNPIKNSNRAPKMAQTEHSLSPEAASTLSNPPNPEPAEQEEEHQQPPPPKKKRNQPGMPDPEAEVIALSPKSLLATNRFVCEICGKGFQRDQNLQLHRRGHNLPWKLRQKGPKRKRVYVCPETTCVHHDPRRALGDLTGIKKHFCRKHGEKNWKCDRCAKKYAVQSDWKAHLKTCGTRQYQCDCGTIFSRRDSFVTHRAFCDALTLESAKVQSLSAGSPPATSSAVLSPVLSTSQSSEMQESTIGVTMSSTTPCITSSMSDCNGNANGHVVFDNSMFAPLAGTSQSVSQPQTSFPSLVTALPNLDRPTIYSVEPTQGRSLSPLYQFPPNATSVVPRPAMSATALLQKAAQMGASASGTALLCGFGLAEASQTSSNPEHGKTMKLENDSSVPDALRLPSSGDFSNSGPMMGDPSGLFGSKPMTLDFLGLGIGGSSSGGGALPGYLTSIGGPLHMAAAAAAFAEGSNLPMQGSWDDQAALTKSKETVL